MEVSIEKVLLTPTSLRFALVIYGPKKSWVRFATATLPLTAVPWESVGRAIARLDDPPPDEFEDAPLW